MTDFSVRFPGKTRITITSKETGNILAIALLGTPDEIEIASHVAHFLKTGKQCMIELEVLIETFR